MTDYVALLRGINVSGRNLIKMEALRAAMEPLGFAQVRTYIQSGNLLFRAPATKPAALAQGISEQIRHSFSLELPVIIRQLRELETIAASNPFSENPYVVFLEAPAPPDTSAILAPAMKGGEQVCPRGSELYLLYPQGAGASKLTQSLIDKRLGITGTMRNWNTLNQLIALGRAP